MKRINKMAQAVNGEAVLMRRLMDTIFQKYGGAVYKKPRIGNAYKRINSENIEILSIHLNSLGHSTVEEMIFERFINHEFCILGSQWICVKNNHGGFVWSTDFRNNYDFDSSHPSDICLRTIPQGVDIKCPWELSRMQHLPFMARMCQCDVISSEKACNEFVFEVSDFIMNNKMGYGVNWACSMDVAIRAVNMILSYWMLCSYNLFTKKFKERFAKSIYEHGSYIYRNLEKNFTEDKSGNHYLSDLCGLIVISNFLICKESKRWFRFAKKEFLKEVDKQIFDDGGNYEFSTAYQRLDSEILALTTAFLVNNGIDVPEKICRKLYAAYYFSKNTLYSDGQIVQIGDNDSGHLFRISYSGTIQNGVPVIDELDGRPSVNALKALFETEVSNPEAALIRSIMKEKCLKRPEKFTMALLQHDEIDIELNIKSEENLNDGIKGPVERLVFPNFGLAVLTGCEFKLFYRLPTNIDEGKPLHIHSDFLHYEYELHGNKYFRDRGSYTYTGDENIRNVFRSDEFHNVPVHDERQNRFSGVWGIQPQTTGSHIEILENGIAGTMHIGDLVHKRTIKIVNEELVILDESNKPFSKGYSYPNVYSEGYGIINNIDEIISSKEQKHD